MEKNIETNEHQKAFNATYIGIREIAERMGMTTNGVVDAKNRGLLSNPILVHGRGKPVYLWKRDHIEPILSHWAECRNAKDKLQSMNHAV